MRSSSSELSAAAEDIAALAALTATGLCLESSIQVWPELVSPERRRAVELVAKRIALGESIGSAAAAVARMFPESCLLACSLRVAEENAQFGSASVARALSDSARALRLEAATNEAAQAATAGARVSARLMAWLPLSFLLLLPSMGWPQLDGFGVTILVLGAALMLLGTRWMRRLMPGLPEEGASVRLASTVAARLRAGASLAEALDQAAGVGPGVLQRAGKQVALGRSWPEALRATGSKDFPLLAGLLERAQRLGTDVAIDLESFAEDLRDAAAREFEARLRRASVLVVVPLTICVLPGFVLLAFGPLLRRLLGA